MRIEAKRVQEQSTSLLQYMSSARGVITYGLKSYWVMQLQAVVTLISGAADKVTSPTIIWEKNQKEVALKELKKDEKR